MEQISNILQSIVQIHWHKIAMKWYMDIIYILEVFLAIIFLSFSLHTDLSDILSILSIKVQCKQWRPSNLKT